MEVRGIQGAFWLLKGDNICVFEVQGWGGGIRMRLEDWNEGIQVQL